MTKLFCCILLVLMAGLGCADCVADEFQPFAGAKPLAVLLKKNPWLMVVGSDTPEAVVYEDGKVVYAVKTDDRVKYRVKLLARTQLDEFLAGVNPDKQFESLDQQYDVRPGVTDQPTICIYLASGTSSHAASVYGDFTKDQIDGPATSRPTDVKPDRVPDAFLRAHRILSSLGDDDDAEWKPRYLEVMVWPYDYAPDDSIYWPEQFPDIDSERAVKRGNVYSIFLDYQHNDALVAFLRTCKPKGAVEINGKKWASSLRVVFPSEPIWRKAFAEF